MTDMRVVRVTFRKQVSDGNYGTEAAEVSLEQHVPMDSDNDDHVADVLLAEARDIVHTSLLASPSQRVRQTVDTTAGHHAPDRTLPQGSTPVPE